MKKITILAAVLISTVCILFASGAVIASESGGHEAPAHGEAASGGGHGGGHSTEVNWWHKSITSPPVGWLIVDFALLVGALYFLLRKPLAGFLVNRRQSLADQIEENKKLKAEIEARSAEIDAKLAKADELSRQIAESFEKRGHFEKQKLVDSAEKLASSIDQSTKLTIEREVESAKTQIREEVTKSAVVIAEDLLKKHLRPEDNDRLVKEFVSRLSDIRPDGLR
ncbi:MAG: ATP synthase F0 subunit B [Myxococcota bacterium]|jgi:F-type H+-transporting ATPase subunit b